MLPSDSSGAKRRIKSGQLKRTVVGRDRGSKTTRIDARQHSQYTLPLISQGEEHVGEREEIRRRLARHR